MSVFARKQTTDNALNLPSPNKRATIFDLMVRNVRFSSDKAPHVLEYPQKLRRGSKDDI